MFYASGMAVFGDGALAIIRWITLFRYNSDTSRDLQLADAAHCRIRGRPPPMMRYLKYSSAAPVARDHLFATSENVRRSHELTVVTNPRLAFTANLGSIRRAISVHHSPSLSKVIAQSQISGLDRIVARASSRTAEDGPSLPVAPLPLALQDRSQSRSITIKKGRDVLIGGSRYDCWYVNRDGWLARYKILHTGGRQILDFILPGEIFGLQACVFKNSLYSVAALTRSSLTALPFEMVDEVLEQDSRFSKALLWSAICEAARLAEHVTDAGRRSAYERLSHLFLELFCRSKLAGLTNGMSFYAPLTQDLIGDALGLTTIHVNRMLRCLREDQLVAVDRKQVTILDFEALSLLSDFENSYLGENARAWKW